MIKVKNLTKRFGRVTAVDNISFNIEQGEIFGFLGPNGAGKTTTMRILSCFFAPTEGEVLINGLNTYDNSFKIKELIGYMPEHVPLYPDFRVNQVLDFVAELRGVKNGSRRKKRTDEVMELCGLKEVRHRITGTLSKGYRQRLGLAQVLLSDPEILILDEPTSGLDPKQIIEIRNLIKSFRGKKTVILSTHILPEVEITCSKVIIINKGRIVAMDTPLNLTNQIKKSMKVFLEVQGPLNIVKETLSKVPGVRAVTENEKLNENIYSYWLEAENNYEIKKEVVLSLVNNKLNLLEMRTHTMSMEDIFMHIVTKEN